MFEIVTRLVILVLLAYLIWYVLVQLVPQVNVKWLLPILLFVLIILGIVFPNDQSISTIWSVISFPLKPIGLSVVLLIISTTKAQEKNVPKNPSLWASCKAWAKSRYDVWPSAYACGAAAKRYKSKGGTWRKAKKRKSRKS